MAMRACSRKKRIAANHLNAPCSWRCWFLRELALPNSAYNWWTVGRFIESTDDAYIGGDVTVIAPKVAGFISQLAVTDNQPVHAGDLLLKLDDRDYRAALAKADAAVAIEQATLVNLDATQHLQEAVIAQAQAGIAVADAEIMRTHDDQVRYQIASGRACCRIRCKVSKMRMPITRKRIAAGENARAALACRATATGRHRNAKIAGASVIGRGHCRTRPGAAQFELYGIARAD